MSHTLLELHAQHQLEDVQVPVTWTKKDANDRKRVNIAGLGDVGLNLAMGLCLAGGEDISDIGLFDLNEKQCARLEVEFGQIAAPPGGRRIPDVRVIGDEALFDCDLFLFCATRAVPAVGSGVKDVRMAQFDANRGIVSGYAKKAAERGFKGLFVVVSDPVDLLCMAALYAGYYGSEKGKLYPSQIQGCGLGVMNARALYYARQMGVEEYSEEGRAFGPHGKDLVIANSAGADRYDDALSRELTRRTVEANLKVRELGFKPYMAPAMSSGVLTILATIRGEWNYSAGYLNGVFFGSLNRMTEKGREWEIKSLPDALFERLEASYKNLEEIWTKSRMQEEE